MVVRFLSFLLDHRLGVLAVTLALLCAGLYVAPFPLLPSPLPRAPIAVDAIPDLGENQQIVTVEWVGRAPLDMERHVTYPLTSTLLGMPGVATVRGTSTLGLSTIYVLFDEGVDFRSARARVQERLAALPPALLPADVHPSLGPEATGLGQVFWYTLEGRGPKGQRAGGWDLQELRAVQETNVRLALQAVPGVAEVSSLGGYVTEWQVDVDPDALLQHDVDLLSVVDAVSESNLSVGARTLEINRVEYMVRGTGELKTPNDLDDAVVKSRGGKSVLLAKLARVTIGPATRRGALDDAGAEAVGGVVVARYGEDPVQLIARVERKISDISAGLPERVTLDGQPSKITVVPFHKRSTLIEETLGTLSGALWQQALVTVLTLLVMLGSVRGAALVSSILPFSVLLTFVAMKIAGVQANFMALAGISIAIGTMVDMAIVLSENILSRRRTSDAPPRELIVSAAGEVAPAVLTAGFTTALSFLPVLAFSGTEGKLFAPMVYTKTFAMLAAVLGSVCVLPVLAYWMAGKSAAPTRPALRWSAIAILVALLARDWMPLGPRRSYLASLVFVALITGAMFAALWSFQRVFPRLLRWAMRHRVVTLSLPLVLVALGFTAWLGAPQFAPSVVRTAFPGFGREFMPPLDEGAFLYMPSTAMHASIGQALDMLHTLDAAIQSVPEVERSVGKLGRADSALDPAPISMFETVVTYKPEYLGGVRQWRDHIHSADDIWQEILEVARAPGLTASPKLAPINTRVLMLQSGLRASMGVKLTAPTLEALEVFQLDIARQLKNVTALRSETIFAERMLGAPMVEIELDRKALAAAGLSVAEVQRVVQVAIGGERATEVVSGAARVAVRVRYMRERRGDLEALGALLVAGKHPLSSLASIRYMRSPDTIRSEDGRLTAFVTFDKVAGIAEVDAVEQVEAHLRAAIDKKALAIPANASFKLAGSFESQRRSEARLRFLLPFAVVIMFFLIHLELRRWGRSLIVVSGIAVCMAGGFLLVWLYGQPWFLRVSLFGVDVRELLQVGNVNLSIAVWVGFIALLGIATDAGVVMGLFIAERYQTQRPTDRNAIVALTIEAAERRVLPALMTAAATALSLLPVLTTRQRGADVLLPMALPSLGGMVVIVLTLFVVPVAFAWLEERSTLRR